MKQSKLLHCYKNCTRPALITTTKKIQELRKLEFEKIVKRKTEGKSFTTKWTLVRI